MTIKSLMTLLIFGLLTLQFVACKKDVSAPSSSASTSSVAGDYMVSSFVNSGNQTATFDGFTFSFNEDKSVVATKGRDKYNGTWKFDDSDSTELKINFFDAPLNELNKGWHVQDLTEQHMLLVDDSSDEDSNDDNPSSHSSLEFARD